MGAKTFADCHQLSFLYSIAIFSFFLSIFKVILIPGFLFHFQKTSEEAQTCTFLLGQWMYYVLKLDLIYTFQHTFIVCTFGDKSTVFNSLFYC